MIFKKSLLLALVPMLLLPSLASHAADKGRLGFSTDLDITGLFRPKLERVTVAGVQPGSPAATAGLTIGDQIIEANGTTIAGAPVRQMSDQMSGISPGEHLLLKVKRKNETVANIDIVAGSR